MTECQHIASFSLLSQPDCIKSFPFTDSRDSNLRGTFVVSCYRYCENTRHRDGCLVCFNPSAFLEPKLGSQDAYQKTPKLSYFGQDLGGILSCSWNKFENGCGVSCISSNLTISQFVVDPPANQSGSSDYTFTLSNQIKLCDDPGSSVALSLSLSDEYARSMCVTCSDGRAYVVRDKTNIVEWNPHDVETWISSFHPLDSNVVLTGSDDSTVRFFDLRTGYDPTSMISCHSSGVTAVQFLPNDSNLFYTGGFDKLLIKHDYRNMGRPLETVETTTPVWFVDFVVDSNRNIDGLHISGCHDGSSIYDPTGSLVSLFRLSDPLIYGTSHLSLSSSIVYCCCDFYNKSIHFYS